MECMLLRSDDCDKAFLILLIILLKLAAITSHAKTVNIKFFVRILEVQFCILYSDKPNNF